MDMWMIIMVGVIVGLILWIILNILCCCCWYFRRRRRKKEPEDERNKKDVNSEKDLQDTIIDIEKEEKSNSENGDRAIAQSEDGDEGNKYDAILSLIDNIRDFMNQPVLKENISPRETTIKRADSIRYETEGDGFKYAGWESGDGKKIKSQENTIKSPNNNKSKIRIVYVPENSDIKQQVEYEGEKENRNKPLKRLKNQKSLLSNSAIQKHIGKLLEFELFKTNRFPSNLTLP